MSQNDPSDLPPLPPRPVERVARPFLHFLHIESAGGIALIICTALALLAANTSLAGGYHSFWNQDFWIGVGDFELSHTLQEWVNDALMAIFFFVIGLEIKREMVAGELRDRRAVVLPVATAIGGAAIPAAIFVALQWGEPGQRGWAIPMATDIAFVVGCLALLGRRIPHGLKVLMLSLAIVDDIIAVLIIALFYSKGLSLPWLAAAGVGVALVVGANRIGIRTISTYVLLGAGVWFCVLESGVHPTVAGALLGLLTPATAFIGHKSLLDVLRRGTRRLEQTDEHDPAPGTRAVIERVTFASREAIPPLERLEYALHPWVAFVIMPIFALANAGVTVSADMATSPLATAVAAGLVLGKPLGIVAAAVLVVRTGLARLPHGVSWVALGGASCLAGIGFTMSLFVASLSFEGPILEASKIGILMGSAVSAALGMTLLLLATRKRPSPAR